MSDYNELKSCLRSLVEGGTGEGRWHRNPDGHAAVQAIEELEAKNARLRCALDCQAKAAKLLQAPTLETVRHLQEKDRSEHVAAATLESERLANAMLTERIDALESALRELADDAEDTLRGMFDGMLDHPAMKRRFDRDMAVVKQAREVLHGAKETESGRC